MAAILISPEEQLMCACYEGKDLQLVSSLLQSGVDPNYKDNNGKRPLMVASENGHSAIVDHLLSKGASIEKESGNSRYTALHYASRNGHIAVVRSLLDKHANINAASKDGNTVLIEACLKGRLVVVELLLDRGADIAKENKYKDGPLHVACMYGHTAVAQLLISKGANIEKADGYQSTPLQYACCNGFPAVAEVLLNQGANINTTNKARCTPLHHAVKGGHVAVTRLLLNRNANVDPIDAEDQTPLLIACSKKRTSLEVLEALLKKGADTTITVGGSTAMHLVCQGELQLLKAELLIKNGADIYAINAEDKTPLDLLQSMSDKRRLQQIQREYIANIREELRNERTRRLELETQLQAANARLVGLEADSAFPFQKYKPHLLKPEILPANAAPGVHDVSNTSPLFRFCESFCNHVSNPSFRLVTVQAVLHEHDRLVSYLERRRILGSRRSGGAPLFNARTSDMTSEQLAVLSSLRDKFLERPPNTTPGTPNTFYAFHGTVPECISPIIETGLTAVRSTDAGFFGSGCYSTLNVDYAARYASGEFAGATYEGRLPVIMFACSVGMAYPITREIDYTTDGEHSDCFGRPLKRGFDCHVACVSSSNAYQCVNRQECEYVEVVMDQESQLLPVAILWFERISAI